MRLKKLVAAAVCGAMLISGGGFTSLNLHAEELNTVDIESEDTLYEDDEDIEVDDEWDEFEDIESDDLLKNNYYYKFNDSIDSWGFGEPAGAPGYRLINVSERNDFYEVKTIYTYDDNGNLIEEKSYNSSLGDRWFQKWNYFYDEKGRIIKELFYNQYVPEEFEDLSWYQIETYKYDSNGNLVEYYHSDEGASGTTFYEYDNNGKLIKATDSSLVGYCTIYEYDANGKISVETSNDKNGNLSHKATYQYDSNGTLVEKVEDYENTNDYGDNWRYVEKYDSHWNLCTKTDYKNGEIWDEHEYQNEYDANGNLVKVTYDDYDGRSVESTYEYEYIGGGTTPTPAPAEPIAKEGYSSMYRLYNPNSGEHFYTANETEKDNLSNLGWKYEGVAWNAPDSSDTPVYRLYNPNAGDHHYTTSKSEKDTLVSLGWKDEGIGWYSSDKNGQALYRLYNPNAKAAGSHHYTTSADERDNLVSLGWRDEGIAWYGGK
ncbi:MAG: hypothetical protein IJV15_00750 [Lachnospiraceae bacterium]|nr:hypothetical protein [Lachnospiraceae bacterium]